MERLMPRHQFTTEQARANGRLGGRVRGEQLTLLSKRKWLRKYPHVDPQIARAIYTDGYNAGWNRGATLRKATTP